MNVLFFILLAIGYIFIFCICIFTLIHLIRFKEKFGVKLIAYINFLAVFIAIIIYSSLYFTSITIYFSESLNLILWKLSIASGILSFLFISLMFTFLKEFKKIPDFPFLYFLTLFGFLIGFLFFPDSIKINSSISNSPPFLQINSSTVNYSFSVIVKIIIILFYGSILIYFSFLTIMINQRTWNEERAKKMILNTVIFSFPILSLILHILSELPVFREMHILFFWITLLGICITLLKKPEMFIELTNQIYYINIYHKSGILLYSYQFDQTKSETDSAIWGNILIGLNQILSEFVDKQNQIDVLQTKNTDIIVHYDDFGFAVVLIAKKKNIILQNLMKKFTVEFRDKYKEELLEIQDLNKLINVSGFTETKELIEKGFQLYIS